MLNASTPLEHMQYIALSAEFIAEVFKIQVFAAFLLSRSSCSWSVPKFVWAYVSGVHVYIMIYYNL